MNKTPHYDSYVKILEEELIPAMGCTEPIAIALAAAKARTALGTVPEQCRVEVSGNIIKNVKSVIVPHTGGRKGLPVAVADAQAAGAIQPLNAHPAKTDCVGTPRIDTPAGRFSAANQPFADTPLAALLGKMRLGVNSYHHQAVKTLAPVLRPMALADDGLIEAAYLPGKRFCMAVQWHPEFSYKTDADSRALLAAFVRAAAK